MWCLKSALNSLHCTWLTKFPKFFLEIHFWFFPIKETLHDNPVMGRLNCINTWLVACILAYQIVPSSSNFFFWCFPADSKTLIWILYMDSGKDSWNKIKQSKRMLKDYYTEELLQTTKSKGQSQVHVIYKTRLGQKQVILITEITRSLHTWMSNAVHLALKTFNVYVRSIILENKLLLCSLENHTSGLLKFNMKKVPHNLKYI